MNFFVNQPREWLEEQLALCQLDIAQGKTLIQWGAGDSTGIRKVQLTPQQRFEYLWTALNAIDSVTYPMSVLGGRVRQTTPRFF